MPAALLFFVLPALAQTDQILPPIGGSGGGQFIARCPQGKLLTGFELLTGDDVDAIRPLCVAANGPAGVRSIEPYSTSFGGTGGGRVVQLVCQTDAPIVTGMSVIHEGDETRIVNSIHLFCGVAAPTQTPSEFPSAVFDGPRYISDRYFWTDRIKSTQHCPNKLVAVGINGRSGKWLDSVGLICGAPKLTTKPQPPIIISSIGIKVSSTSSFNPPVSICELARQARARNSVAAPNLEAQCRAAGIAGEAPAVDVTQQDALAAKLAAKGEAVANRDPLSAELRNREPEGPSRRGFAIGMAAAEGQTLPGPGKQRMHDSLSPAEQSGFRTAVAFSLERNRNAEFAAKGAVIAELDAVVAEASTAEADVFYWPGFDIATGIFSDPALGAQGNTATGAGSLKIRDSLSAAGQRGFNASVGLHLSRNYKRTSGTAVPTDLNLPNAGIEPPRTQ